MKKISYFLLLAVFVLSTVFVSPSGAQAASQYTGGLLDGEPIQVGTVIGQPLSVASQLSDNNPSTYTDLSGGKFAWYTFSSPVEISAVVAKSLNPVVVEFYDSNNNLLQRYELLNNDGVQTLPAPVQNVSTVALKYTGSSARVYEWNVFTTPSTAPLPTTINWIQSGDQIVKLDWAATGAESYNVKRATSPGGPYILLANVKDTTYSDTTVTNGTTYYYVITTVNRAGESANSPEKGIKPDATKYTGGLLDWLTLQVGKSISSPTSTTRNLTDNNPTTLTDLSGGNFVWYTFSSPVKISAVIAKSLNPVAVEFYDSNNNLLQRYELLNNDGVQTLPAPVQNVSTVALKYTGSSARVYEWNVFTTPSTAPLPTTINWIQSGDQIVKLDWAATGAESYNVKRATSPGGPYILLANVKDTTYSDTTVTNGTTYYYVITTVNRAGESANSPEKGIKPDATKYTGGLLDWLTLQVGKSISSPTSTTRNLTDNNPTTLTDLSGGNFVWYTFSSPVEISAVIAKYLNPVAVEFYDSNNNLLQRYELSKSDEIQTLPAPIQNVSTVALKYTGSSARVYEWNVFGKGGELPPEAPSNLTAAAGNKSVVLNWNNSGNVAMSFNVKRATVSGGPYSVIGSVTGDTYSYIDNNVVNGTTYFYVVTAVSAAGESANSNEASATPRADVVNPPIPGPEGERALLRIILINGIEKEYDLSMSEVVSFINWYEGRANGTGTTMYAIDKHNNNKGPFVNRKDYVFFDKIITFEVNGYNTGTSIPETPPFDPEAH
ncbi:fibronectin type III domain-containing protein [Paenibacillus sp. VCA1]|uniref:fibronectin type III domain-containing protein n=1 Tax=Paenibacillus sp. VCA1 TaxID=3039148 RepID=UPI0028720446|nr:fibronectin type III domain-containing protein [Paenibacillus sp. VCA1]MDR9853357.1 fibronectin type III domain-containing protein [Paenibacillus sp. VCA1]